MSLSDAEIDALEQLQEAIESGDVSLLRKLLNQTDLGGRRELGGALVVGHDVEERRQGVQRAGRHHDDVDAVLRGAGRRRAVERWRRQREFFLSRPRLCVLGSDVAAARPRRRRRSDGRGTSRQCPGGVARRAGADFFGRALTASSAPRSSGGDASRPAGA